MKIIIEAQPKEIADLVEEIHSRPEKLLIDLRPPMNTFPCNNPAGGNGCGTYPRGGGGGGINYERITAEALSNIDRTLSTMSTLLKDFGVSLGIKREG